MIRRMGHSPLQSLRVKTLVFVAMLLSVAVGANASEKQVTGRVTYVAAGTIYTSLGRESGVNDSSVVYVLEGSDTIAVLQAFAVSSKSTACHALRSSRQITVGMLVVAFVPLKEERETGAAAPAPSPVANESSPPAVLQRARPGVKADPSWLDLKGRVSAQFYTTRYDNSAYDISQPGLVLNLRGKSNELPIMFEVYGNFRTLSYGGASPFAKGARNQSRLYRLSLAYDDGVNAVSFGRIAPQAAPSIGYIDGLLLSRKFGDVTLGGTLGYQPSFTLRGILTDYRKFAGFVRYESQGAVRGSVTGAYARTYFHSQLDREVANAYVNLFWSSRVFLYASGDFDLRKKAGDGLAFSPSLSTAFVNVNYRMTRTLSLGLGADASRPVYTYSLVRSIPDSMIDRRLRAGVNLNVSVNLPWGISLYNTYTPRASESSFARDYSEYAAITFTDIAASGVMLRSNVNVNSTELTNSLGYGLNIQRNVLDLLDLGFRYQQYNYKVKKINTRSISTTYGADLMVNLSRTFGVVATYDRLEGYGTKSNAVFAEFSVRF